tara:strand:- start:259 stop:513 length:255 start_codon:yes stop_codon:yes gene_type:complete
MLAIFVFNIRNIHRIVKEVNFYQYKPIIETFYHVGDGNFRIQKKMEKFISQYDNCIHNKELCSIEKQKLYKKYGKLIFKNRDND